jgi:hypothetical protein
MEKQQGLLVSLGAPKRIVTAQCSKQGLYLRWDGRSPDSASEHPVPIKLKDLGMPLNRTSLATINRPDVK